MFIVGCGYVGGRLARRLQIEGQAPLCLTRNVDRLAELASDGLPVQSLDLDIGLAPLSAAAAEIFFLAPPPGEGTLDTRMAHFLAALDPARPPRRIVYISTTGVYGDCAGAWVDESWPIQPGADRSRRRLDAERRLLAWRERTGTEIIILRVAGIYGPDRLPLERLRKRLPMVGEDEAPWTNRIHVDDLVEVLMAAMGRGRDGEVYNVSDGNPGNMRDYFDRVADLAGLERPPLVKLAEADGRLSAGLLSYLKESRRLANGKLVRELGVELRYPSLAEGLPACTD